MIPICLCDDEETVRRQRRTALEDILFFETAPKAHHVYLHTADSRLDFVGSPNELEKALGGRFVRTHRAYLAAWDKSETAGGTRNRVQMGGRTYLLFRAGKAEWKTRRGGGL